MLDSYRDNDEWTSAASSQVRTVALGQEIRRLIAAGRRQLKIVLIAVLISGIAGAIFVSRLSRLYTANAFVLIDNRRVRAVESNYDVSSASDISASYVDSQVEVVKSGQVAEVVVKKLNLLDKPLPDTGAPLITRLWSGIADFLSPGSKTSNGPGGEGGTLPLKNRPQRMIEAIEKVQMGLEVQHIARTMVIEISYTAHDAVSAAEMANAYADAYITDQLNAKYTATRRASVWLEERLGELKQKALASELAVQKFRADNNLITSSGKLVNEQQLTELNTQLGIARSERARADARYTRIKHIIDAHETKAVVSDAFGSTIIEQLRAKYLDTSKREAELVNRVGPEHQSVLLLREEMQEYDRLIFSELSRMAEGYLSEVNIARAKELSLQESLERLIGVAAGENKLLVTLHGLEQEGESYRNLYQGYLQRYQESLQQQSFPIVEARVITPATEPLRPSYPKKSLLLMLFLSIGGFVGSCIGIFREFRESGFRSQEQIKDELGLESLGIVPIIKDTPSTRENSHSRLSNGTEDSDLNNPAHGRITSASSEVMNYALEYPNSTFGEALLASKLAVDVRATGEPCKIIGIMSALPNEGKTSFAKNFASMLASRDTRALLIDGDLRKTELSRALAPYASRGLLEAATENCRLDDLVFREPSSGLDFLPAVSRTRITHSSDILASPGMHRLLAEAKLQYDYIVIDLPPFGPVVDVRAIAPQVHAFVLVIEWRRTSRRIIRDLLHEDERINRKCLGVILNKVDVDKIKLFEEHGSRFYHFENYKKTYYFDR